jgi:hypothetical protein
MPANDTIFELRVRAKGQWRTLGTFDDANVAIAEAIRLRRTLKYSGIRVTEESYQNNSGKFASRVVYRYSHQTRQPGMRWPAAAQESVGVTERETPHEAQSASPTADQEFVRTIALRLGFVLLAAIITLWMIHAG